MNHYKAARKAGLPLKNQPAAGQSCAVDGCQKEVKARRLCSMHSTRLYKTGDVGGPDPIPGWARKKPNPKGGIGFQGYVTSNRKDRLERLEHRHVMSEMLGRPLLKSENVHHINGVRHDNRPENLELWTKSQPPGQRVADKVAWAIELLELYAPEVLTQAPTQMKLVAS
jgi:hypothetical protein